MEISDKSPELENQHLFYSPLMAKKYSYCPQQVASKQHCQFLHCFFKEYNLYYKENPLLFIVFPIS
jgi:hypothetical protein